MGGEREKLRKEEGEGTRAERNRGEAARERERREPVGL